MRVAILAQKEKRCQKRMLKSEKSYIIQYFTILSHAKAQSRKGRAESFA